MDHTNRSRWLLCAALLCGLSATVAAGPARSPADKLRVVTTIPDLADLARRIGGERVEVTSLCRGRENLHAVSAKPSHLVALSRADLFVQVGLSLEMSFVPNLLLTARNERLRPGSPGFVNCSEGWEAIQVPADLSRKGGDLHPQGNPHMNLSPRAGRHMAQHILAGLQAIDPPGSEAYAANCKALLVELDAAEARWAELGARWKGRKVVVYHQEFNYLADAYGIGIAGTIEVKPGIPPTPNHLAGLLEIMQRERVGVILTASWSNNRQVEDLAERSGARAVELPSLCGGRPGAETWIGMMDLVHRELERAFAAGEPGR